MYQPVAHTIANITGLQAELDKVPTITKSNATANMLNSGYILPSVGIGEMRFHTLTANNFHSTWPIKFPSGGTYGCILENSKIVNYTVSKPEIIVVASGGSNVMKGLEDTKSYVFDFFYTRIS